MKRSLAFADRTTYDLPLIVAVLGLLAVGVAMVFSASGMRALDTLDDPRYYLAVQSGWAALGLGLMVIAARIDYHRYRAIALPALVIVGLLLVVVLVPGVGTRVGGAARWLRVSTFAQLQPAEVAKLALILYLGSWMGGHAYGPAGRGGGPAGRGGGPAGSDGRPVGYDLTFLGIVGVLCVLVVAEPDLGTAIVIALIGLAMYFVAGAKLRLFAALGLLAVVLGAAAAVAQPYRMQRLLVFLDPWSDERGAGFQTIQGLYGLALGGPLGEGLGAGREKFGFLPAPYTDSIFAVVGDELGMIGTLGVILLFLVFASRGVRIALRAPDPTGALLATGITAWLSFQAWINMAVVASLLPFTGITLPFISYGGSSLCVGLIAVGILINVGRQGAQPEPARLPRPAGGRRNGRSREPAARGGGSAARTRERNAAPVRRWSPRSRG